MAAIPNENQPGSLEELKSLREKVNWEIVKDRRDFLRQLRTLIKNWIGPLPDLREMFTDEQIDWLLSEHVESVKSESDPLVVFVIGTGYRDRPKHDEAGRPVLRRSTAVHRVARYLRNWDSMVGDLFRIYDRYDVNYADDDGLTHFHVACKFGLCDVAEKFLELGVDPNLVWSKTGDSSLHLALARGRHSVAQLLLKNQVDLNLSNSDGLTPMHIVCKSYSDGRFAKKFFEIHANNRQQQQQRPSVNLDARDNLGMTPLQWAVANLLPEVVDVLLDNGADLSNFAFPAETYFGGRFRSRNKISYNFKLRLAASALDVVERLEKREYELEREGVQTVMKFFASFDLFEEPANVKNRWYDDEEFAKKSAELMMKPNLSLHELIRLRPEQVTAQRLAYADYFQFARRNELWDLPEGPREACLVHLCEIMSRRFFRRWALDSYLTLSQQRLAYVCCDHIVRKLMNRDLYQLCLAKDLL